MNGLLLFQEAAYGRGEEHRLIIGMRHHEKVKIRLGIARHNRKEGRKEGRKEMANQSIARIAASWRCRRAIASVSLVTPQMGDW